MGVGVLSFDFSMEQSAAEKLSSIEDSDSAIERSASHSKGAVNVGGDSVAEGVGDR